MLMAESLMMNSLLQHPRDLIQEPLFTCCPADFLGTDIYATVTGVENPRDLIKEPLFTNCPTGFLGTDIYTAVTGSAVQEEPKHVVITDLGKQQEFDKFVKKPTNNKPKEESKTNNKPKEESKKVVRKAATYEEAICENDDSIELNRRIDKFKRRRARSKQLKKREHDKKLYDAKKLAAKLARTI